jgi:uncharacterized protein YegL
MSMLEQDVEIANPQHPHCPTILVLDTSGSMNGDKINALNAALVTFRDQVCNDPDARQRVDLAVVTFGAGVNVLQEFSSVESFTPPTLPANGMTPMGEAIDRALDMVEERKKHYRGKGVDYYRPWVFLITDGEPTDMKPGDNRWFEVVGRVSEGETGKKFMFFVVGVEPANLGALRDIAPANRPPVMLKGLEFHKLFEWLGNSLSGISRSTPGETVPLPSVDGWANVTL